MDEKEARRIAQLIQGEAIQTGGDVWIVIRKNTHSLLTTVLKLTPYGWEVETEDGRRLLATSEAD